MISLIALARSLYPILSYFPHGTVHPPLGPVNVGLPVISGTLQVGHTVSVSNGAWTNSPTSYAFQWQNEGRNLAGAGNPTTNAYTLQASDIGCLITCTVAASNGAGTSAPALSALAGPTIGATAIYVSQGGNDTTGTGSINAPYKSLNKINSLTLSPGTSVLFQRGGTWRNDGCPTSSGAQLSPGQNGQAASGTPGNPIVFDAYGTGANPIIDGSYDLTHTTDWQATGTTNVWQSTHQFNVAFGNSNGLPNNRADDPGNLIWGVSSVGGLNVPPALLNASYGVMKGAGTGGVWYVGGENQAGLTSQGQWNFNTDTNRIQVYCVGNPATTLTGGLRAAIDACNIYFDSQHDLTFQNMTLNYCGGSPIDTGGAGGSCSNITIRDMVIQWFGGGNISGSSNADSRYGDGWDIEGSCSGMMMERVWFHQGYDTAPGPQCGGGPHQDNITVRNCVVTDCGGFFSSFFLGGIPTCSGLSIYNNTVYLTQNAWSNNPTQRPNGTENVVALYLGMLDYNATTHVATVQSNMAINNNVFAGIGGIGTGGGGDPGFGLIGTAWNIAGSPFNYANPFTSSGAWLNYNCWPVNINGGGPQGIALNVPGGGGNFSISSWAKGINTPTGAGTFSPPLEVNGIFSQDPQFTAQSSLNFALQPSSPCHGTGANLFSQGVVWDFNHNPRPSSGPFSMGAFESAPVSPPSMIVNLNMAIGGIPIPA